MEKSCCQKDDSRKQEKGILKGILYGIFPHSFCIGFIIFSAIGAVTATAVLKKIMIIPYFLHILFIFSIVIATFSAVIYLKRCDCFNKQGAKSKWKYLAILYGTTIFINLLMFSYVLPVLANINSSNINVESSKSSILSLKVDIPCSGHAPLIIDELKKDKGVESIKFESPNIFEIKYNPVQTSPEKIILTEIFKTYKAQIN